MEPALPSAGRSAAVHPSGTLIVTNRKRAARACRKAAMNAAACFERSLGNAAVKNLITTSISSWHNQGLVCAACAALVGQLQAQPTWAPPAGRYDCVASAQDFFDAAAKPIFSLELKPGNVFVLTAPAQKHEGQYNVRPLRADQAKLGALFERSANMVFAQAGQPPALIGVAGSSQSHTALFLQNPQDKRAYLRCGDLAATRVGQASAAPSAPQAPAAPAAPEREQKSLPPPAPQPGKDRLQDVFVYVNSRTVQNFDPGPYGGMSRITVDVQTDIDFLAFQSNGYVRLEAPKAGQTCTEQTIDKDGDLLCTTYSIDGGQLRVGTRNRGAFKRSGNTLEVDGKRYLAAAPLQAARLAGAYDMKSCYGAICRDASWTFSADGKFSTNKMSQGFGSGTGPAGLPYDRSYVKTGNVRGTYRINGLYLTLQPEGGPSGDVFAFLLPGGNTLRIEGEDFLRRK
jgi:hypothetical protein